MSTAIATEKVGTRVYVTGNSYAVKDQLKSAGCHWDGDRRQWWIGAVKADLIATIVGQISSQPVAPAQPADTDSIRLVGKAKYKGKMYYARWIGYTKAGDYKVHLTILDAAIDFWAKCAQPHEQVDGNGDVATIIKTYQVREYRGHEEHTTLGSIRRFIDGQKTAEKKNLDACAECGKRGHLHHDLEDGMMKCYNCCDIPQ